MAETLKPLAPTFSPYTLMRYSFMPDEPPKLSPRTEQAARALGIAPSTESDPMPPQDLRTVPKHLLPDYEAAPLILPPDVQTYLTGLDAPMTAAEIESIEDRTAVFHSLTSPWVVTYQAGAFRLQRE